jgi:nicotinamidase-related amidase
VSLFSRPPRPIKRSVDRLRDDRLFIVACDDRFAPKQYFDFFQITRVHVHVVPTTDGTSSAPHVLERLLKIERDDDDELWMLLDTDHCTQGNHLPTFIKSIQDAKQRGVKVALSRPCFELWLLLHHVDVNVVAGLADAQEVEATLRTSIGSYNKTRLNRDHFDFKKVADACARAHVLDEAVTSGDIPDNNSSRVYLLWKAIASKALRVQLPTELHSLLESP